MALIRYPGSKERIVTQIINHFPQSLLLPLWANHNRWEYREPFFGAGAIGFRILSGLPPACSAWLNDKDWGIVCLWNSIRDDPKRLAEKVEAFEPSVEAYNKFKAEDGRTDIDIVEVAFRKLALHQMSFSGLGAMSGGPLGGQFQDNGLYSIDCRWSTPNLLIQIARLHKLLRRIPTMRISCKDFEDLIDDNPQAFLYLDPPYYEKGEQLYKFSFEDADHIRLAKRLQTTENQWVLSYDDHERIRELYSWAHVVEIQIAYTVAQTRETARPKNREILILKPGLENA